MQNDYGKNHSSSATPLNVKYDMFQLFSNFSDVTSKGPFQLNPVYMYKGTDTMSHYILTDRQRTIP